MIVTENQPDTKLVSVIYTVANLTVWNVLLCLSLYVYGMEELQDFWHYSLHPLLHQPDLRTDQLVICNSSTIEYDAIQLLLEPLLGSMLILSLKDCIMVTLVTCEWVLQVSGTKGIFLMGGRCAHFNAVYTCWTILSSARFFVKVWITLIRTQHPPIGKTPLVPEVLTIEYYRIIRFRWFDVWDIPRKNWLKAKLEKWTLFSVILWFF